MTSSSTDPHAGQPVPTAGAELAAAKATVILIHGRGGNAQGILQLARTLDTSHVSFLAPQAADASWYPRRFLVPAIENEPGLSSALAVIARLVDQAVAAGIPHDHVVLGGFSQGACLSLEAALRMGGRFGGVFALSGAVIGEPGADRPHDRSLDGTPVFLGCGDVDAHIPVASVRESSKVLKAQGAAVTERIYPGLGHIVVSDETDHIRKMLAALSA